jgi:adenylate kinase family enzyme
MKRVSVVGTSGSGKSTFARALADRLGLPFVELDSIYHQRDWKPLPDEEFRRRVGATVAGPAWVVDGNYSKVRDVVWRAADTVVILAYPRWLVMRRVVSRTVRRAVRREELWNGNREPWSNFFSVRPESNIMLWAWTHYQGNIDGHLAAMSDPEWSRLTFYRFTHPADADRFLDLVAASADRLEPG